MNEPKTLTMYDVSYYVVFEFDGIERKYACKSYFDAVMLKSGMEVAYPDGTAAIWTIDGVQK
jgi:hypothetical protein